MAKGFGFLLEMTEDEGREWLKRYLRGETTEPAVPFDLQPVEFLLGEVNPMPEPALPLRVGILAGALLAEAIQGRAHRTGDTQDVETLFTLVESLPTSEDIVEFLHDLAVTARLLPSRGEAGTDLHLLTLRALVPHQRPVPGALKRLIRFWEGELDDLRYAPIAIQGLLRVSVAAAVKALPEFVRRARGSDPPIPLANTLFAVSVELGTDRSLWENLVEAFEGYADEFDAVRETFGKARLPESNPDA